MNGIKGLIVRKLTHSREVANWVRKKLDAATCEKAAHIDGKVDTPRIPVQNPTSASPEY